MDQKNTQDPIPALDRATALAVSLYDEIARTDDAVMRMKVLLLLAHLRAARIAAS